MSRKLFLPLSVVSLSVLLSACGGAGNPLRSYDAELSETVTQVKAGQLQQALDGLEKRNAPLAPTLGSKDAKDAKDAKPEEGKGDKSSVAGKIDGMMDNKDLLYFLEKGELLSMQSKYPDSRDAWLKADDKIREWEDSFKLDAGKLFGDIASYVVGDRVRRYDGQDYEKVFLSTRLTLNHILRGDFASARVEMKKTYEREKLIEAFREKEYDALKDEGEKKGIKTTAKDLKDKGYPMAELDAPEVSHLKNGFQNAFSHYLAGYFFEVTGEPSLAEPGYRNALTLQPNSKLIRDGLSRVGKRKPGPKESDVLFVVESGFAPSWKSISIPLPLPMGSKGLVVTPLSFPVVKAENKGFVPPSLTVGGKDLPVETLASVDAMSRRMLKDQLPGIMLRTGIRAIVKTVAQEQAQRVGGVVGGLVVGVASVLTEQADERAWRTLPERVSVARAILPYGKLPLSFQTDVGVHKTEITLGNRFTIVPIRLTGGAVFVGEQNVVPAMPEMVADSEPVEPPPAPVKKPKKAAKPKEGAQAAPATSPAAAAPKTAAPAAK
ncbi:MAG: hypothetical protein RIR00_1360 [Pseudomonadota bacterium]